MPTLTLTYFNAPGRAEPIRLALRIAGLPFEDRRLTYPEFAALKAEGAFPLGSVADRTFELVKRYPEGAWATTGAGS